MSKLPDPIAIFLESSVNRYLALDPCSSSSLSELEEKSIELKLSQLRIPIFLKVEDQKLKVLSSLPHEPDARLSTSLPSLAKMAISRNEETILGADIEMSGNMEVGRQFRNIFINLDIDWEEVASKYTGDIIAHKLGNGIRVAVQWLNNTGQTVRDDIAEYLHEESAQLPSELEVTNYINAVDEIRLAVDRAEARIKLVSSRLTQPGKGQNIENKNE